MKAQTQIAIATRVSDSVRDTLPLHSLFLDVVKGPLCLSDPQRKDCGILVSVTDILGASLYIPWRGDEFVRLYDPES